MYAWTDGSPAQSLDTSKALSTSRSVPLPRQEPSITHGSEIKSVSAAEGREPYVSIETSADAQPVETRELNDTTSTETPPTTNLPTSPFSADAATCSTMTGSQPSLRHPDAQTKRPMRSGGAGKSMRRPVQETSAPDVPTSLGLWQHVEVAWSTSAVAKTAAAADITQAPTAEADFYSRTGVRPYYEEKGIVIVRGDCRDVLPTLERVDHVITDPPYSEVTHEGARTLADLDCRPISFTSIKADDAVHLLTMAGSLASRWTIATVDWRHMLALEAVVEPLRFVRFGVWIKPNGAPQFTGDRPATGWEAVAILHRTGGRMRWNCGGHHAVWTENIAQGEHPTQKPIELIRQFVADFTDPGDLILDPFMGSGTTLRAAKDLGRRAIGIELSERWCEVAAKRLSQEVMPL